MNFPHCKGSRVPDTHTSSYPPSESFPGTRQDRLSTKARLGLAIAFAVLIAVKMPDILLQGRFWAEEGEKFFRNAWLLPWPAALLSPWGGYLNITANLAGVLAWHVSPLEWAPYASTLLALAFQVCPAIVLLTSRIAWLDRPLVMVAALLLLATPPVSEEVWLSSIGTQCHLTLCAALILACGTRGGAVGVFRLVLLALAALSGPGSWMLTPLFAARAAIDRSWQRALQAVVLGGGVLLQALFFYSHEAGRAYAIRPLLFLDTAFTKHVLVPFFWPQVAKHVIASIHASAVIGRVPWWPAVAMAAIVLAAVAVLAPQWRREPFWMALAAAVIVAVSYAGMLGNFLDFLSVGNGGRYTFAPQVLTGLALLGCAATAHGLVRSVVTVCVGWLLIVGIYNYFLPAYAIFSHGPSWRTELALHRRDPSHVIASWPPGWIVPLPP